MKTAIKVVVIAVVVLVLFVAGTYAWASMATSRALGRTYEAHSVEFPVPLPDSAAGGVVGAGTGPAADEHERAR
jgi:hypothetical protein